MQMGMRDERLAPGVEHREEADRGAEMLRIGGNGAKGLRGRAEQRPVDDRFVLEGDGCEGVGDGEDDVEILAGQSFGGALLDPRGARD